ncbi:asparagine synthase-related protein [Nonomuraea sp. KM90]|uniref:asparagine synthase-related protein n=1 Tax=Nonomuraea sp. KM90 TaxID=3457428 RepID=UPI003FCD7CDF
MDTAEQSAWFVALPDAATARAAGAMPAARGGVLARHPSGRPWIIGHGYPPSAVPPGQGRGNGLGHGTALRLAAAGRLRVAVAGFCPVPAGPLQHAVARAERGGHVEDLLWLPGSFHLITCDDGQISLYGDVAGLRRLYHTRLDGLPVAGDRAVALAALAGGALDERWLAARLLSPEMPADLLWSRLSPYREVVPVPPGHRLHLDHDGATVSCYWRPPEAVLPLPEGADVLRTAVSRAVEVSVSGAERASVQLSGGWDSAALAALACRSRPAGGTLLLTVASATADNPDVRWARRTAARLGPAEHRVLDAACYPQLFDGLDEPITLDEPASFTVSYARVRHLAEVLTCFGSRGHLNGQGGDEVLLAPLAYLAALWRRPVLAWHHLRGYAALSGVGTMPLLTGLLRGRGRSSWQGGRRSALRWAPAADRARLVTGWEAVPWLPPWATAAAAEHVAALLDTLDPPAGDAVMHATVTRIRACARRAAAYRDALAQHDVPAHFPYFDRAVVEACLATRPEQRTTPYRPKPLLAAALEPIAPGLLARRDKGHHNHDLHAGLAAHTPHLLELFGDECVLARAGLIDAPALRRALTGTGPSSVAGGLPLAFVTDTVAVELWLRHQIGGT